MVIDFVFFEGFVRGGNYFGVVFKCDNFGFGVMGIFVLG